LNKISTRNKKMGKKHMKKTRKIGITICLLSIFMLTLAGNASAYNSSYTHYDYNSTTIPTIDGQYTGGATEYAAGASVGFGTDAVYRDVWGTSGNVQEFMILETMDTTNNATDSYTICYDSTADGGTSPKTDDFKIVITGHGTSAAATWYRGTGTAWAPTSGPASTYFEFKESLATSPTSAVPHYMVEVRVDKQDTTAFGIVVLGMNFAMRVAYNDTHASLAGVVQSWPPAPSTDTNTDTWGYVPYSSEAVPENFSVIIAVTLSSIAVVAGSVLMRKHSKQAKYTPQMNLP
jgi:hypothetical protein